MRSELECENRDFLEFLSSQIERQDLVGLEAVGVHSVFWSIRGGELTEVDLACFLLESIACWRGGCCESAGRL